MGKSSEYDIHLEIFLYLVEHNKIDNLHNKPTCTTYASILHPVYCNGVQKFMCIVGICKALDERPHTNHKTPTKPNIYCSIRSIYIIEIRHYKDISFLLVWEFVWLILLMHLFRYPIVWCTIFFELLFNKNICHTNTQWGMVYQSVMAHLHRMLW